MDLNIISCNNFIKLKGVLNKNNIGIFQAELLKAYKKYNALTISIEELQTVDCFGVNALADFHTKSLRDNKELSIVGLGCKALYEHFKANEAMA
ncbi:STAS domain-containing protein [Jejuia pallidilutea]|uniref:STAS domain-containing protein n=1 Tax=Jejuia pallidilutea TaxID=504487 RepID=A0A090WSS0_9FLAO|nr:STAS domain-containing protein [Jejuia pallidilutea]GAL66771.1 hypothetical protein JCM19301_1315 [Jejuia pallidilutea]GAL70442.1 hypothetical protein JCM19302_3564 [Jejuia pallidilutea]GAL90510.1 hypothetical protein JCM19538_275 [Jejuia pallidilutea]